MLLDIADQNDEKEKKMLVRLNGWGERERLIIKIQSIYHYPIDVQKVITKVGICAKSKGKVERRRVCAACIWRAKIEFLHPNCQFPNVKNSIN